MNQSKQDTINTIEVNLPDNTGRLISPAALRTTLQKMLDFPEEIFNGELQQLSADNTGAIYWDLELGSKAQVVLDQGDCELIILAPEKGGIYYLIVKQDANGGHTLRFSENSLFKLNEVPLQPTALPNAIDIFTALYDGTNYYWTANKDFCRTKDMSLVNFKGVKLWGYPFALFDSRAQYVRVIYTKEEFMAWWAASEYNHYRLIATPDPVVFKVVDLDGFAPVTVTGLNCFQMDTDNIYADSVPVPAGGYIDWGDGVLSYADTPFVANDPTIHLYTTYTAGTPYGLYVRSSNLYQETMLLANNSYRVWKQYADTSRKTITVMFNGDEDFRFTMDNATQKPAVFAQTVSNLRGFLPLGTKEIEYSNTQTASFNTFSGIQNWPQVRGQVLRFALRDGDSTSAPTNLNFNGYDLPNLRCLDMYTFTYANFATTWTPVLLKDQLGTTDIPSKFPRLTAIAFKGDQYSNDLNLALPNIKLGHFGSYHYTAAGAANQLPGGAADRIMQQIDNAITGKATGVLYFFGVDTDAGAAAKASLMVKGMTVVTNQ